MRQRYSSAKWETLSVLFEKKSGAILVVYIVVVLAGICRARCARCVPLVCASKQ